MIIRRHELDEKGVLKAPFLECLVCGCEHPIPWNLCMTTTLLASQMQDRQYAQQRRRDAREQVDYNVTGKKKISSIR
jgi:hypothetical protein